MVLVYPVSSIDASLATNLSDWLLQLGGFHNHSALIVFGHDIPNDLKTKIIENISRCALTTNVLEIPTEIKGWPQGPNAMFKASLAHLMAHQSLAGKPWYFFEADNTPVVPGWLDMLQTEYNLANKPFMGVRQKTLMRRTDTGEQIYDGEHMVGTSIYPPNMLVYSTLIRYAHDIAWDVYCQWEVVPHMHDSSQMQHNWCSWGYYRHTDGYIDCLKQDKVGSIANPIRDGVVVVHGCKDGTLLKLLRKEAKARK